MGLLLLTLLGALLGWLNTMATRTDTRDDVVCNCGAGIIGAVLAGALTNPASLMKGLSGTAFLLGMLGAATFIALVNVMRARA